MSMESDDVNAADDAAKRDVIWNSANSLRGKYVVEDIQIALDNLLAKRNGERDFNLGEPRYSKKVADYLQSIVYQISANLGITELLILNQMKDWIPDEIFESLESQVSITQEKQWFGFREVYSEYGMHAFVVGFFGFLIRQTPPLKLESSLLQSLSLSRQINDGGVGLFMFPGYGITFIRNEAVRRFAELGCHVSAVIRTPRGIVPGSGIQPLLVVVEKKPVQKTFVLDANHFESIGLYLPNFFEQTETEDIQSGIWTNLSNFDGFEAYVAREKMAILSKGFTADYRELRISDIAMGVNLCAAGSTFTHVDNSVYIPLSGRGETLSLLGDLVNKHQGYCQVVLNSEEILAEYLANFLGSPYGRLCIEEARSLGSPKMNRAQILDMQIAVPSIETQRGTCDFVHKLTTLRNTVIEIEDNVSLNPVLTKSLLPKVEEVLSVLNMLSVEDRIKSLIRRGEAKDIEFKETFVLDVKQGIKNKEMTKAVLKTIAGFLNTDGGELLVGVNDAGEVLGVNDEMSKFFSNSRDKYLQNVRNAIKERIGEQSYPFIDYQLHEVESVLLLCVTCLRSDEPVYVDEKDFYIRINPATDKLEGRKLLQYIRTRFG